MEYDNENSGVLFKNEKATTDKHPGWTGKINVDGKDYRLACWIKEGKKGKFMSLKVSELMPAKPQAKADSFNDLPDDLPF